MLHSENTVVIDRAPDDVYAFLVDGMNGPRWRSGIASISLRSGAVGQVGAEYAQALGGPGRRTPADYRLTVARPGDRIEFEVIAGPLRPKGAYALKAVDAGTQVTFSLDAEPTGLMRLMTGTIRKTMTHEVGQLDVLKRVLEEG